MMNNFAAARYKQKTRRNERPPAYGFWVFSWANNRRIPRPVIAVTGATL